MFINLGLITFRFYYVRDQKPYFSSGFGDVSRPPPNPILFIFADTRTPNTNQENSWGMFDKYFCFFVNMGIMIWNLSKIRVQYFCFFSFFRNSEYLTRYQNLWRWGSENDEHWLNKIFKIWDLNFITIKNMTWEFANPTNFSIFK